MNGKSIESFQSSEELETVYQGISMIKKNYKQGMKNLKQRINKLERRVRKSEKQVKDASQYPSLSRSDSDGYGTLGGWTIVPPISQQTMDSIPTDKKHLDRLVELGLISKNSRMYRALSRTKS